MNQVFTRMKVGRNFTNIQVRHWGSAKEEMALWGWWEVLTLEKEGSLPSCSLPNLQHDLPAGCLPSHGRDVNSELGLSTDSDFGQLAALLSELVNKGDRRSRFVLYLFGSSDFSDFHDLSVSAEAM